MNLRVVDAYPARARTAPGDQASLMLELTNDSNAGQGKLTLSLFDQAEVAVSSSKVVEVAAGHSSLNIEIQTPSEDASGYYAKLELATEAGTLTTWTAVLVASHWRVSPRYGFLSEFGVGEIQAEKIKELAKFHITVVQFYDWMYRHYQFLPPQDLFADALGRELSLSTVRERIDVCHALGMAALAYGAVYGAEPEFVESRPDWLLKDAQGQDISLINLFYITDIRAGTPWREHILSEYERCVEALGFDGIHMDQYGFPKWAYTASGAAVDVAGAFPTLINEASARVGAKRDGAAVLFNAVNNWPVEEVAKSDQAAVYIEVWPPHDSYVDLVNLITRARDLSGKQVILAAYLQPFREGGEAAEYSALLATAVIACAGGHHLLLGEGTSVLRDPYYPNHGHLRTAFLPVLRRYYDHTAAYTSYLHALDLKDVTSSYTGGINTEVVLTGADAQVTPMAGKVWITVKRRKSQLVINLVNLTGLANADWDAPKGKPCECSGLALQFSPFAKLGAVTWASPDQSLPVRKIAKRQTAQGNTEIDLPLLSVWATVIVELVVHEQDPRGQL